MRLASIKSFLLDKPLNRIAFFSVMRHIMTAIGTVMVAAGWIDEATITQIIGAIMALVAASWDVYSSRQLATQPQIITNDVVVDTGDAV